MSHEKQFYINGQWVEPSTNDTVDVINPATEEVVATIALGGVEDVNAAVAAARAAFESYSRTSREERIALLERIVEIYQRRSDEFARAITLEWARRPSCRNTLRPPPVPAILPLPSRPSSISSSRSVSATPWW